MSDVNSINLEFLNNIEPKYKYAFRYDYLHKNLLKKARQLNKLIDYIHIIECSITFCKETNEISRCRICSDPIRLEKNIVYISLYSKQLIAMFVSYFGCSLSVASEFFGRFKIATYTFNGLILNCK
jgi:recombinational DNA repair protein RecR